jgi:hypothetical protein
MEERNRREKGRKEVSLVNLEKTKDEWQHSVSKRRLSLHSMWCLKAASPNSYAILSKIQCVCRKNPLWSYSHLKASQVSI